MSTPAVPVEITTTAPAEEEIEIIGDLDDIAGTEPMLGCNDDNPYR